MKIIFCLLFLNIFTFSSELNFTPLIKSRYDNQGGLLVPSLDPTFISGWGGKFEYKNRNIKFFSELINFRFIGKNKQISDLTSELGIGYYGRMRENGFDFTQFNFKFNYFFPSVVLEFGKYGKNWGPTTSSLIVSNKTPSYPHIGFNWKINSNYSFDYFYGKLNSQIPDSIKLTYYKYTDELNTPGTPFIEKYIVAHRINWQVTKKLLVGASETVIYGGRGIDMNYLFPFNSFWATQNHIGSYDNVQMSLDIKYEYKNKYNLYGMLYIDELKPSVLFKKNNNNWVAYQTGIIINDILHISDELLFEYTWTDHRIYRHKFNLNNFYSYGFPLGFWAGPHSTFFQLNYKFIINNYNVLINFEQIIRGGLSTQMLEDQYNTIYYERFKDSVENRKSLKIELNKTIYKYFDVSLGVLLIDWQNAGFNPLLDNLNTSLESIFKYNYYISFAFDKYLFKI